MTRPLGLVVGRAAPGADAPPDRYPDALMLPKPFQGDPDPAPRINRLFSRLFDPKKVRQLYVRAVNHESPQCYFVTGSPDCTRHYPALHPLASLPRYAWFVVGETDTSPLGQPRRVRSDTEAPGSVKLGWLIDAEALGEPSADQKVAFERSYADQVARLTPHYRRLQALESRPADGLSAPEREELQKLKAYFS